MRREMMVKGYVGMVRSSRGYFFTVFTTGDPAYLLFCPMDSTGHVMGTIQFPILKKNLRRDWRKFLVA